MASRTNVRGIEEDLWFGDYSDAEAEKKAAESVAATVGRVVGAKPFPVAAQRLAEATRDPDCSLIQVVRILERDMALSARVLRLVNSASFALRTPCTSVRHAASLVGTQKLNQLATTAAILDMVDHTSVHASRILEHSAVVGGLCRYLGVHLGLPADELFTCGFLHDIGKLMLLEVEGKRYGELLTEVGSEYDAIHLYERDLFGFDHALLAGHVLSRWSIPEPVPKVVAWHHHVTRAYEEGPRWASLCSVLRLADLLAYALASEDDEAQVERAARSESASYLDISAAQLAAIWDELRNLHERSRALFRGEEPPEALPPVSLRPSARIGRPSASKGLRASHPSLRAPTLKGLGDLTGATSSSKGRVLALPAAPTQVAIKEAPEGPKQFPCVVCSGPSFANICPACHGYVCPEHQRGADEWCKLCRTEYVTEAHGIRLRPILVLMLGAGLGATVLGAAVNMATGHGLGSFGLLVGPLIGTGLAAGFVAIFHRYARRAWFVRTRPNRSAPEASHISTPLPPDPAKEKADAGARDSARPFGSTSTSANAPLESIFAREASGDSADSPAPLRTRGASSAPSAAPEHVARSRRPHASRAPTPLKVLASMSPRPSSRAAAPADAPASVRPRAASHRAAAPTERDVRAASVAPRVDATAREVPSGTRRDSVSATRAPTSEPSIYPGEESTREAAERGRTLRLLSEHSSPSAPAASQAPSEAQAPSTGPEISVRPLIDSNARPVQFPDWSKAPPAQSVAPASEAAPPEAPASASPAESTEAVREPSVHAREETTTVTHGSPSKPPVAAAGIEPSWRAVLQATGTADGW